ncbi:ZER1 [Cordylochernes scorpioides]|uniref:ZER1 n=1 Tax=Cordylochernes scorpioides TaxID=51811 RepID=A0ABY6KCF0_9ARAC|nr:ZER1 [Cordylochernes scorpioides]
MLKNISLFEPYSPDSLQSIALKNCLQNRSTFCVYDRCSNVYRLASGISLPTELCEKMLDMAQEESLNLDDSYLAMFSDPKQTRLTRANIRHTEVSDHGLSMLCLHPLRSLDISDCTKLTTCSLMLISRLHPTLEELVIGSASQILPENKEFLAQLKQSVALKERHTILNLPRLHKLVIRNMEMPDDADYAEALFGSLTQLRHLDLSNCIFIKHTVDHLRNMPHLTSLTLFNVPELKNCISTICQIKTLKFLDISQTNLQYGYYPKPNNTLKKIAESLPDLVYLDISGTNLAGTGVQENLSEKKDAEDDTPLSDIPGLHCRVNRPLEFLGLFNTSHEACYRHHIPAKRISGDANEEQILTAAQLYLERPMLLQKVLNDLFHVFRYQACRNVPLALHVVMAAMRTHLHEKHIQIAGSASLFYIVKGEDEKTDFNIKIKRQIISVLLNAMNIYQSDTTMLRNSCLTLIHFKIPQDVLFEYERLVDILLHIVLKEEQDDFVQRIGIYLLNSLACQVEGKQKQLVGDRGAIRKMLQLVRRRLKRRFCDEVMETAWSTMWNVTDETPINCQRFLDENGMELFLGCLREFSDKADLLRNMMGLLGNVAEVKALRPRLMKDEYVKVFSELLDSRSDGIEVSYNATGILSHMMCDGEEAWASIVSVTRAEVAERMTQAISRWELNVQRNINYRSFEPILRLLTVEHSPVAMHWAVWALANLTRMYPDKYCPLLRKEGGIQQLGPLCRARPSYPAIPQLALRILQQCEE